MSLLTRFLNIPLRLYWRNRRLMNVLAMLALVETFLHIRSYDVPRPSRPLDAPFSMQCQEPDVAAPRENATILMLARNSDLHGAVATVRSLENAFNRWFNYPITFLNDKPWDRAFIDALTREASGPVEFAEIDAALWGFPPTTDPERARAALAAQRARGGVMYAGRESYHHMCRFNSGGFYDVPELRRYRWYWRVEPDVQFTCAVTYDPFAAMAAADKRYGYVMALWEIGDSCPSLFRTVADYRRRLGLRASGLWTAMMDASWAPLPFRWLFALLANRDRGGDAYNLCHFWSNFEIADMDWFRSERYRAFFRMLDEAGGFYTERWGDAPVHSLAAALLLEPREVHHFADFGYVHDNFQTCPGNAAGGQLPGSAALAKLDDTGIELEPEREGALGCRCRCPRDKRGIPSDCLDRIRLTVE